MCVSDLQLGIQVNFKKKLECCSVVAGAVSFVEIVSDMGIRITQGL